MDHRNDPAAEVDRRAVLARVACVCAAGPALLAAGPVFANADPAKQPPAAGDTFVHLSGPKAGQPVLPEDIEIGVPRLAYPVDATSGAVRKTRPSQVVLVRTDPATLSEETRAVAWNGIVAYSAICTHNGCPVTATRNAHTLLCPCHESEFDAADKGKVVHGPAERRLANLPLQASGDRIVAAGPFSGPIGVQRQ